MTNNWAIEYMYINIDINNIYFVAKFILSLFLRPTVCFPGIKKDNIIRAIYKIE